MNVFGGVPLTATITAYDGPVRIPREVHLRLSDETIEILQNRFRDVVRGIERVNVICHPIEIALPVAARSVAISLTGAHHCLKKITRQSLVQFIRRGAVTLVRFDLPDGPRLLAIHTSPQPCPTRAIFNPTQGVAVDVEFLHLPLPCTVHVSLCLLDVLVCFNCGSTATVMRSCRRCRRVGTITRYCSRACQAAHWAVHKPCCGGSA